MYTRTSLAFILEFRFFSLFLAGARDDDGFRSRIFARIATLSLARSEERENEWRKNLG